MAIKSKRDFRYYLEADRLSSNKGSYNFWYWLLDPVWKFQRALRFQEYLQTFKSHWWGRILIRVFYIRLQLMRAKLGFSIPEGVFGPGLSIAHYGFITINAGVHIGKNCRIHNGVVIGQGRTAHEVPRIGDNAHIGPGVKIIGEVVIGDNVNILANAVVTKSFKEGNCTIGGVPAKYISDNTSLPLIVDGCKKAGEL